jgi:hypothetical protein
MSIHVNKELSETKGREEANAYNMTNWHADFTHINA